MAMNNILIELLSEYEDACFSGGAKGADRIFGEYATENGFNVIHFSFFKHKFVVPKEQVLEIPEEILKSKEIYNMLKKANNTLNRKVPQIGTYNYFLLARNRYQILLTERIYCMSPLISPSMVGGGTAWAVQMMIDSVDEPEIYCFCTNTNKPYKYCNIKKEFIEVDFVPTPHGKWTGIGSRDATDNHFAKFKLYFKD